MNTLKLDKFANGLVDFYRIMLLLFGAVEVALLWVMSIFFICYVSSDTNEATFFCKDNALVNLLVLFIIFVILVLLNKKSLTGKFKERLNDDDFFKKIKKIMLWIIAILGFAWVIITQYVPGSDQLDVMSSAYKYATGATDMVEAGGYLDKWPHNIGITTIERLLAYIVGDFNIMFIQLLNVIGIVLIYQKMASSWDKLGGTRFSQVCTLGCGIAFYPLIMYASFVYGNIWNITFALIAFDAELKFFKNQSIKDAIICILTLSLSFMAKGSAIIFLVALCIYAIIRGITDKIQWHKILLLVVAMCISVEIFAVVPKSILEKTTGVDIREDGIWAFIAMGLQEDGTAPGWYNGYCLNVYYDNGRDTELAEQLAKEETFNRLNYLFSDKHNAYEFFSKKIASMWIEPTYQSYWINQVRNHRTVFPAWLASFMSAKGYTAAAKIFDVFEIIILTGMLLWVILEDKTKFTAKSFLLLCFIGGFTFSLMWETKSQYSITYFIMLFPYAIEGFELMLEKGIGAAKVANKFVVACGTLTIVLFLTGYVLDASRCLSQHNAEYSTYVEQWNVNDMTESVNDINNMKEWIKCYIDERIYYKKLLEDNGIAY